MLENLSVFGDFTRDAAVEDASKAGGNINYLSKLPVGTTVLRMLPPAAGRDRPWVVVHQHFVRVPGVDKPIVFNCPEKMANQKCPACEQMRALEKTGNPADFEAAKKYAPQFRVFANVIDRKNPNGGPLLWGFGAMIFKRLTYFRDNEDACGEDFTHPIHGYDIIITRTGTGQTDTRYQTDLARKASALADTEPQMIEWANAMADLEKSAYVPSWKEISERVEKARSGVGGSTGQHHAIAASASAPASTPHAAAVAGGVSDAVGEVTDDDIPF